MQEFDAVRSSFLLLRQYCGPHSHEYHQTHCAGSAPCEGCGGYKECGGFEGCGGCKECGGFEGCGE